MIRSSLCFCFLTVLFIWSAHCQSVAAGTEECADEKFAASEDAVESERPSLNDSIEAEGNAQSSSPSTSQTPLPAHHPSVSPDGTHVVTSITKRIASVSPSAGAETLQRPSPPIDQVFVPLKEWKQKKLEALESRARRIQTPPVAQSGTESRDTQRSGIRDARRPLIALDADYFCPATRADVLVLLGIAPQRCLTHSIWSFSSENRSSSGNSDCQDATKAGKEMALASRHDSFDDSQVNEQSDELIGEITEQGGNNLPQSENDGSSGGKNPANQIGDETLRQVFGPSAKPALSGSSSANQREPVKKNGTTASNQTSSTQSGTAQIATSLETWWRGDPVDSLLGLPIVSSLMKSIRHVSNGFYLDSWGITGLDIKSAPSATFPRSSKEEARYGDGGKQHAGGKTKESADSTRSDDELSSNLSEIIKESAGLHDAPAVTERPFNFASADAGARILSYSNGMVGAKNVIEGSVDKYSLAPCDGEGIGGSRWIDIELSEEVILESIEAANFEYYSSSAKRIAVLGASSYPTTRWNILGVFDFADVRTIQRFKIEKRGITRFLRVMFAGKQGHEYYCPISTVQAFGKTLLADWKDELDAPGKDAEGSRENLGSSAEHEGRLLNTVKNAPEGRAAAEHEKSSLKSNTSRNEEAGRQRSDVDKHIGPVHSVQPNAVSHDAEKADLGVPPDKVTMEKTREISDDEAHDSQDGGDAKSPQAGGVESGSAAWRRPDDEQVQGNPSSEEDETNETMSEEDQLVLEAVRANALSSGFGDDNIFRKVTRMLRLLELNQTLTNQYIDTHLSRFAAALSNVQRDSTRAQDAVVMTERRLTHLVSSMDLTIRELRSAALKRDVIMCALVICIAFLLGTHWVLWTAVSGTRLHGISSEFEMNDYEVRQENLERDSSHEFDSDFKTENENFRARRRRRKSMGEMMTMDMRKLKETNTNWRHNRERSVSSTELSAVSRGTSQARHSRS